MVNDNLYNLYKGPVYEPVISWNVRKPTAKNTENGNVAHCNGQYTLLYKITINSLKHALQCKSEVYIEGYKMSTGNRKTPTYKQNVSEGF